MLPVKDWMAGEREAAARSRRSKRSENERIVSCIWSRAV